MNRLKQAFLFLLTTAPLLHAAEKANFVLIFTDDQGYGDLGCFGSETIRTPHLDRLAAEGRKFTSFLSASSVCTPSRAALLTGCYPKRVGFTRVLSPTSTTGLNPDEHTIADHLKQQGYATACFGKWHIGHHPETLPRQHGFDVYFGIPYSNDMNHPDNVPDEVRDPDPKRAYVNTIEHIDTELGRIFDTLRELELAENTYVIFTTDNGPWLSYKHHAGSAGPLRGGKFDTFEGGQRVPCIIWAPGRIPAGTETAALASTIDLLPTIAALTNTPLPADRIIDGVDISPLLTGDVESPRKELIYFMRERVEAIREGDWKLIVKPMQGKSEPTLMLYNLAEDIGEKNNLATHHPELVERLHQRMLELDADVEAGIRPAWSKP